MNTFLNKLSVIACLVLLSLTLRAGNATYNAAVAADAPIAHWTFDETTGTNAADIAGAAQNGIYENCSLGQTSAFPNLGTCALFNGTNARVRMPFDAAFNLGSGNFTVELWYRTTATGRGDMFNFKAGAVDFGMFVNVSGANTASGWHNGGLQAGAAAVGSWHHMVYVRETNVISLYINGNFVSSQADVESMSASTDIIIGANINALWFTGEIDEVAYYGGALSAGRVSAHYAAATATNPNAPVVTTAAASGITASGATIGGAFTQVGSPAPAVTMYYGLTNGGSVPANWSNSVALGTQSVPFSTSISGLLPATQYFAIARAQNATGDSYGLPAISFTTANGAPVVANIAASNIVATGATLGAQVTTTGGLTPNVTLYYGTTDGGTTAGSWASSVNLGAVTTSTTTALAGLSVNTQYFFRAFATHAAGNSWAATTASFTTPTATVPALTTDTASDVNGFSSTLRGTVTNIGNDPPVVKFYYGTTDGGTGAWASNVTLAGTQTGAFAHSLAGLAADTQYFYRAQATNAAGTVWASTSQTFTTAVAVTRSVVINEIHYNPVELPAFDANGNPMVTLNEEQHEFIEIRNMTGAAIPMSGWQLSNAIQYNFASGVTLPANGYLVIAKNPARLQTVYAGLTGVLGPYTGELKNGGATLVLKRENGTSVDTVSYDREFPWPNSADGLGAGDDFTLLNSADYQYKGRSLQRVSPNAEGNDPANWLASPIGSAPTPGAANAVSLAVPKPVLVAFSAVQASDDSATIRATQAVRVTAQFSSTAALTSPQVEYFIDAIDGATAYSETRSTVSMTAIGNNQFTATLPGQADRSVVRWRVKANRGSGVEQVFPRTDDAAIVPVGPTARESWAAYFVQPVRSSTKVFLYDVFISNSDSTNGAFNGLNGLAALNYNITGNPRRVTDASNNGLPRDIPFVAPTAQIWNGSVPCIHIHNGVVRDAHIRYHGSRYSRSTGRQSYKMRFADTQLIDGADSFFITDKSDYFSVAQGLYINAGLPMSEINWIDWYLNGNAVQVRLQQGEYNGDLLDKYHTRIKDLNPGTVKEENGEFYKSTGTIEDAGEGPYGHGSERVLTAAGVWTALQRYEWTYALQNNGWKGAKPVKDFIEGMWTARGDTHTAPAPNIVNLRAYLDANLDVDTTLHSLAVLNWMCPWDNTTQNHFLWKRANGRWSHIAWDFDSMFGNGDTTSSNSWIYLGENGTPSPASNTLGAVLGNNFRGPNWFEDSVFKAYRTEYTNKLWILNNTFYTVANLQSLQYRTQNGTNASYYSFINGVKANFCEQRFQSVNIQTGHAADGSDFFRPTQPTLSSPVGGATSLPPASLTASTYTHTSGSTAGGNAHASSKWEIRSATGNYFAPLSVVNSTTNLTSLPIPFSELTFGETYFWRVTYTDASAHPSLPSAEASFVFGAQPTNQTLIAFNATGWKYNATMAFIDNSWTLPAFNDASWTAATGVVIQSGEGVPTPGTAGTVVTAPGSLTPAGRAYLFRKQFTLNAAPASVTAIQLRHLVDDGCVIWINGNKIHRYFMNEQANYTTAEFTAGGGGPGEASLQVASAIANTGTWAWVDPRPFLVQGVNTIAVEVHQSGAGSSDVMMGVELTATIPSLGNQIAVNEIAANPSSGADWVELKNVTASTVDISGWGLTDDILVPGRYTFPAATSIAAGAYLRVYFDNDTTLGSHVTGFGLSAGGQNLLLTQGPNNVRDYVAFGPQARGFTIGRVSDGVGAFTLTTPTPAATNSAAVTLGSTAMLRVNEWMAQPAQGDDWFEIYNGDALPVSIAGLWLSDTPATPRITRIPALSYIAGKGFADFRADGSNDGFDHANFKLSAGGDNLVMSNAAGTTIIDSLAISSGGANVSRGRLPDGGATIVNFPLTESKSASNWLESAVVVNEALTNSVLPLEDSIELHNPTGSAVDISGWWLSDDKSARQKFQIPGGTTIAPGGFVVFSESQFNAGANPFLLSSLGDEIVLTAASVGNETGYRSQVGFGVAAENVSFGRVRTGNPSGSWKPEFWPQVSRTPGAINNAPLVTPVIINEVHFHPIDLAGAVDNARDEFVELHNPATTAVDLSGWKLKGACDFTFPNGATLRPGEYILVVGFNPADTATLNAFASATIMTPGTVVFGPFAPKLANDGGDLEIARPTLVPGVFVNVDKISYTDFAPWPTDTDGLGGTLQRFSRTVIGNDPANWQGVSSTPGRYNSAINQTEILDNDGDGIPNAYEDANGLNKYVNDANGDLDGDGQSNLAEYLAGTAPNNAADRFVITSVVKAGGPGFIVTFPAKAGKTYTIQYKNALTDATWLELIDVPAQGGDTNFQHTDTAAGTARFYRIITPQQ